MFSEEWLVDGRGTPASAEPPTNVLDQLGFRAAQRRKFLGLSREAIGLKLGVSSRAVALWEKSLPKQHMGERELLWEKELEVEAGWLRVDPNVGSIVGDDVSLDLNRYQCKSVADEILCIAAWLSRKAFPRRTVHISDLSKDERRLAEMFSERFGVLGENNTTLQAIANRRGLTRERVRQVVEKLVERSSNIKIVAPKCLEITH